MELKTSERKNLIKGRLRELFGIPNKLLPKLKYQIKYLSQFYSCCISKQNEKS